MSLPKLLLLCLASTVLGATGQEDAPARPNGVYFQYALYFAPKPTGDPLKVANRVFEAGFRKDFTYRSGVVRFAKGNYVEFRSVEPEDYPPPKVDYLEHKGFGTTAADREHLQKTSTVLVIDFFIVDPENYEYLAAANRLALEIAEATKGFLWDEETRELFSTRVWKEKRPPTEQPVFANTSMHGYQLASGNFRSVTFGMRKLGLPDLVITEFPKVFWEPMSEMMRFLVYQVAVQGPLQPTTKWEGATLQKLLQLSEKGDIPDLALVPIKPEKGDPRNDLLTVDFMAYPGGTYHEKQAYAVDRLMRPKDGLLDVWNQREQLMALSEAAQKKLQGKRILVQAGLPEGEKLLIKAFVDSEYRWLQVAAWEEDTLKAVEVPRVGADGTVVAEESRAEPQEIKIDQVFDYLHIKADGSEEGNETTKFIQKVQSADEGEPRKPLDKSRDETS